MNDIPPLTLEEISVEQGNDGTLMRMREWIDAVKAPTLEELEGLTEDIRTYADLRKHIYVGDKILGVVDEPFTGFPLLIPHVLVDKVIELGHTLAGHKGLKRRISLLTFLSFPHSCSGLLP